MPRPRKPDGREPKSRSRNGCWSCKARKVKCTEERPSCAKCVKGGYQCDYGIRLNWDGRRSKRPQLRAVHLDTAALLGAGDDAEDDSCLPPEASPLPGTHQQLAWPPLASPPSTSVFSLSKPVETTLPFTAPVQAPLASKPTTAKAAAKTTLSRPAKAPVVSLPPDTDSPFRVLTPTTMSFEVPMMAMPPAKRGSISGTNGTVPAKAARAAAAAAAAAAQAAARKPLPPACQVPHLPFEETESSADIMDAPQRAAKRQRLDSDVSDREFAWQWPTSPSTGSASVSTTSPRQLMYTANSLNQVAVDGPSPRAGIDGEAHVQTSPSTATGTLSTQAAHDIRRLSVGSLLSGPQEPGSLPTTPPQSSTPPATDTPLVGQNRPAHSGANGQNGYNDHYGHYAHQSHHAHHTHRHDHTRTSQYYGVDAGFRDLDLDKNDDSNALSGMRRSSAGGNSSDDDVAHDHVGYYRKPVAVRIPRGLGQLPPKLTENPMNMLYFHHFINNTARVLVPHDDPQSNPFRTILPQMALKNDNLLSLLLAYSASHRARVLGQTEPAMRIALWVQDIFPALRQALDDHKQKISNANVATAIMLASLAIVSPTAFGYNIPWQRHLMLARELIAFRPEGLRVDHHSSTEGQVCAFLWSWFAYIDVLGGLSGGPADATPAWILDYKVYDPLDDDEIDCIMGFTTRCVYILSQIAELVRQCEPTRLRVTAKDPDGWIPSMEVEMRVESLEVDVRDSMKQKPRACTHLQRSGDVVRWDRSEMEATNEAYHWAALVQLHRRVLGKPADHADVQSAVQHILECIDRVRFGGTAENCLLFPIFTAGCECLEERQRRKILNRIVSVEETAMMQVTRARALMQRAWGSSKPWETLLTGEFIG